MELSGGGPPAPGRWHRFVRSIPGRLLDMCAAPFFLCSVLLGALSLSEGWFSVLWPDPEWIAEYHFGSECMMAHGGWTYASPELHGCSVLFKGLFLAASSWIVGRAILRRSWRAAVLGMALYLTQDAGMQLAERIEWGRRDHILTRLCSQHCTSNVD